MLTQHRDPRRCAARSRAARAPPGSELSSAVAVSVRAASRAASMPNAAEQRVEVAAPRDRDGDVADRVLEDQVPPDDPGDELAERRVRVRVRAARLRNHRRQLGVAQRGEPAHDAEQNERDDQRRAGAVANHHAVRQNLAGRGRADRREDSGADHRADREHDQVARAQRPLQRFGRSLPPAAARRSASARRGISSSRELVGCVWNCRLDAHRVERAPHERRRDDEEEDAARIVRQRRALLARSATRPARPRAGRTAS